ncbi:MAG: hypothetical protein ACKO5Q_22785 [Microcystaceae cyanobacterium]
MKSFSLVTLTACFTLSSLTFYPTVARASWGDFFLGVGAAVGVGAIVNSAQRQEAQRYAPAPPQEEYYRGVQDGMNGAKYDNPRNSPQYDQGYEVGVQRRQQQQNNY